MNELFSLGNIGNFFVSLAFVAAIISGIAYLLLSGKEKAKQEEAQLKSWRTFARIAFGVHAASIIGIAITLFSIIVGEHYEYHYAYQHSSSILPAKYIISCFWEGQEGSFLLWLFWHVLVGSVFIWKKHRLEAPAMAVFMLIQIVLSSMLLGISFPSLQLGSSPFMLVKEVMPELQVYINNPDFIHEDGTGLNPLLQNIWMVIHPPTLFLGFALTTVPFALTIAALWRKDLKQFIPSVFPWLLISTAVLGIGIMMGAYWAYETLNFGGYWNWDPVENAVYVPWIIMLAAVHAFIFGKKSALSEQFGIVLMLVTYVFVMYSTYLTRSGVLGSASVHSFTDLGLNGQLILLVLVALALSAFMYIRSFKAITAKVNWDNFFAFAQAEAWILAGTLVMLLSAIHVIGVTSFPVYNKIFGSHLAAPVDAPVYYSNWQIWFAAILTVLASIGQGIFWFQLKKKSELKWWIVGAIGIALFFIIALSVGKTFKVNEENSVITKYMFVFLLACLTLSSATVVLIHQIRKSQLLTLGGGMAHLGFGLLIIGLVASSGLSNIISTNMSGRVYNKKWSTEMNTDNILIYRNEPLQMSKYSLTYKGARLYDRNLNTYINKDLVWQKGNPSYVFASDDIHINGELKYSYGDSIFIEKNNTYYEIEGSAKEGDSAFTIFPRAQVNPSMGGILASPDVISQGYRDLYAHVSSIPTENLQWNPADSMVVSIGDTFYVQDYMAKVSSVTEASHIKGIELDSNFVAIETKIDIYPNSDLNKKVTSSSFAVFDVGNNRESYLSAFFYDFGAKVTTSPFQETDSITNEPIGLKIRLDIDSRQKDWVILKVVEKPLISLVWAGTLLIGAGLTLAFIRRRKEAKALK